MPSFDLVDRPWIPCLTVDGRLAELSLREALTKPQDVREIVDPAPTVTVALHRLLLAVLHRALDGPRDIDQWREWWEAGTWDAGAVSAYLDRWRHRFDLFAEERPFYQSYEVDHRYTAPITKLTHELASPANAASLFDHTLPDHTAFSPAQAARYLVAHQAFAVGGLVSGVGDEKYADAAALCKAAVCLAKGANLFRTLMLNLVAYDPEEGKPFEFRGDDRPAWERDQGPKPADRRPDGYLDLLTWQSRRILLLPETKPDGTVVVPGVVIMKGEQFPDDWELWQGETMVPFRKVKDRPPFPLALSEDRALWRDSLALMQTARARVDESLQPPRLIDWLTELVEFGALDRQTTLPIDIYGLTTDQAAVRFWRHERFPLPAAILDNQQLVSQVKEILDVAESAGETLRQTVRDVARATLPDGSRDAANLTAALGPERSYWPALEIPFYQAVRQLAEARGDDASTRTVLASWAKHVGEAARRAFDEAIEPLQESPRALLAIAEHQRWFTLRLHKTLRVFVSPTTEEVTHG